MRSIGTTVVRALLEANPKKDPPRKFGPKTADHPSIGEKCPACGTEFKEGDFTALVPIGPGDDEEAKKKARDGRWYSAVAVEAHWGCVTGEE